MPSAVAAFRLLLLTGCRMSEIRDLRWDYVKDDCIELPDAKTGGRVVPLGPEARTVLSAISRDEDNPWVIAGRLPGSHLTDLQRPWRRIRKQAGLEGVRIHDLRHSFASRALALGESLTMIGNCSGTPRCKRRPAMPISPVTLSRPPPPASLKASAGTSWATTTRARRVSAGRNERILMQCSIYGNMPI